MGTVEGIFITAQSGQPMQSVDSAEAVTSKGLHGDRKFRSPANPKKDTPDRELTLIESESIEAVNRDYPLRLEAIETRRNILTRGVPLNHLVGKTFTIGAVKARGLELCEPCKHVEKLTRPGVMRSLVHRGGLRAEILAGGTIRMGDRIELVPDSR